MRGWRWIIPSGRWIILSRKVDQSLRARQGLLQRTERVLPLLTEVTSTLIIATTISPHLLGGGSGTDFKLLSSSLTTTYNTSFVNNPFNCTFSKVNSSSTPHNSSSSEGFLNTSIFRDFPRNCSKNPSSYPCKSGFNTSQRLNNSSSGSFFNQDRAHLNDTMKTVSVPVLSCTTVCFLLSCTTVFFNVEALL